MPNVSFTLFEGNSGTFPKYGVGAEKNVVQYKSAFPEWDVRIYYHSDCLSRSVAENLQRIGATMIDVKNIVLGDKKTIHYPYFWRFFSFFEDDFSISRDLDSRLSDREISYIKRWMDSGLDYFTIRDHPWQDTFPAGLVGMKNNGQKFKSHFIEFVNTNSIQWGSDQEILRWYMKSVSPKDIYYCGYDDPVNYIDRDDESFFIGMQMDESDGVSNENAILSLKYLKQIERDRK